MRERHDCEALRRVLEPRLAGTRIARPDRMCDSPVLTFIDAETSTFHASSDAGRLALLTTSVGRTDYLSYLVKLYLFEAPIESALTRMPGLESVIPLRSRMCSILLAQDLLAMGLRLPKIDRAPRALASFDSVGEALGWLFVVERGRRLHGTVRRHLSAHLPHELRVAGAYLTAHERRAFANWRELGTVLDRFAKGTGIVQQVLAGSRDAFHAQQGAFIAHEAHAA